MGHRRAPGYGYTRDYQEEREQRERDAEAEAKERALANEGIRKERRAALDAQKRAAEREHTAAVDVAIAPRMAERERQWQIDHPGEDFAQVKHLVRQQLIEEDAAANHERVKQELLSRTSYPY